MYGEIHTDVDERVSKRPVGRVPAVVQNDPARARGLLQTIGQQFDPSASAPAELQLSMLRARVALLEELVESMADDFEAQIGAGAASDDANVGIVLFSNRIVDLGAPPAGTTCLSINVLAESAEWDSGAVPAVGEAMDPNNPRIPLRYCPWPFPVQRLG